MTLRKQVVSKRDWLLGLAGYRSAGLPAFLGVAPKYQRISHGSDSAEDEPLESIAAMVAKAEFRGA